MQWQGGRAGGGGRRGARLYSRMKEEGLGTKHGKKVKEDEEEKRARRTRHGDEGGEG